MLFEMLTGQVRARGDDAGRRAREDPHRAGAPARDQRGGRRGRGARARRSIARTRFALRARRCATRSQRCGLRAKGFPQATEASVKASLPPAVDGHARPGAITSTIAMASTPPMSGLEPTEAAQRSPTPLRRKWRSIRPRRARRRLARERPCPSRRWGSLMAVGAALIVGHRGHLPRDAPNAAASANSARA